MSDELSATIGSARHWLSVALAATSAAALSLLCLLAITAASAGAEPSAGGLAPEPTVSGETVQWNALAGESSYKVAISRDVRGSDDRGTVYLSIPRTASEVQSYTPEVPPGATVYVGVSSDGGLTWSSEEVAVSDWAASGGSLFAGQGEASEDESERDARRSSATVAPTAATAPIVGANDAAGWGAAAARTILDGHITWNRVELGSASNTLASSLSDGFKVLAIVNNVGDSTPLSAVDPGQWGAGVAAELAEDRGISIAEAGNESYFKGGVANPVQYGRMYMAAIADLKAAGIRTPLLFNMIGDYPRGSWASPTGWSEDSSAGGWLRDAVNAVPGLARAILANGVSVHPYGALGENVHDDYGVSSVAADESVARAVLGSIPPLYITEVGYDLSGCGRTLGACTRREQAGKLQAAYNVFLADPHVAGIWWYQSHDDGTGRFGFMNSDNTTRPAFRALSAIATMAGQ